MVLWNTESEETLFKKISKNLEAQIYIGHYIQTFL